MPSYLVTIAEGHLSSERVSQVLDGPAQARSEAVLPAGEMLWNSDGQFWDAPKWRLHVTDEEGVIVCELRIEGSAEEGT